VSDIVTGLAGLGLAKALALEPGKLYALQLNTRVTAHIFEGVQHSLKPLKERFGCDFLILDQNSSIVEFNPEHLPPTPVDVVLPGQARKVLLDGEDISADVYRAEIFADGTGFCYCFERDTAAEQRTGWKAFAVENGQVRTVVRRGRVEAIAMTPAEAAIASPIPS
jgi:hypothetical protein